MGSCQSVPKNQVVPVKPAPLTLDNLKQFESKKEENSQSKKLVDNGNITGRVEEFNSSNETLPGSLKQLESFKLKMKSRRPSVDNEKKIGETLLERSTSQFRELPIIEAKSQKGPGSRLLTKQKSDHFVNGQLFSIRAQDYDEIANERRKSQLSNRSSISNNSTNEDFGTLLKSMQKKSTANLKREMSSPVFRVENFDEPRGEFHCTYCVLDFNSKEALEDHRLHSKIHHIAVLDYKAEQHAAKEKSVRI